LPYAYMKVVFPAGCCKHPCTLQAPIGFEVLASQGVRTRIGAQLSLDMYFPTTQTAAYTNPPVFVFFWLRSVNFLDTHFENHVLRPPMLCRSMSATPNKSASVHASCICVTEHAQSGCQYHHTPHPRILPDVAHDHRGTPICR